MAERTPLGRGYPEGDFVYEWPSSSYVPDPQYPESIEALLAKDEDEEPEPDRQRVLLVDENHRPVTVLEFEDEDQRRRWMESVESVQSVGEKPTSGHREAVEPRRQSPSPPGPSSPSS